MKFRKDYFFYGCLYFYHNKEFRKVYLFYVYFIFKDLSSLFKYPLYTYIWVMFYPTSLFSSKWLIFL